ncbi:MAG: hypothetical protein ACI906_004485 [Candidatus Latescibacterota bacterium]|jgi:hypothetical protein
MRPLLKTIATVLLLFINSAEAQRAQTFIIGSTSTPWRLGGSGIDPKVLNKTSVDTTNSPDNSIEYERRPGWISPLFFEENENIASRVLSGGGSITSPDVGRGFEDELRGTVNGSPTVAFTRKPTAFEPDVNARNVRVILDFFTSVGVQRVRFYPRNTVVPTPTHPFQNDFLRAFELWVNSDRTSLASPDILIVRNVENEEPIVEISVPPQYVRLLRLKSLANVPFEIDEIEVYGTGFLQRATYLTDIIDLGQRATIGPVRWTEEAVGDEEFSSLNARVRTGLDSTPIRYNRVERGLDLNGNPATMLIDIGPNAFYALDPLDRGPLTKDDDNWSTWRPVDSGELLTAPTPRRYVQFQFEFEGELFRTREMDQFEFDFLSPPIADGLIGEVFPRLTQAEEPATFRYAVRLERETDAEGDLLPIFGFDRLEIDTNVATTDIRDVKLDGELVEFEIDFINEDAFGISFPLISHDQALLELTFDMPIFRFGTTFSGRAFNSSAPEVPQSVVGGNSISFGPGDDDVLSGLSVSIPKPQIGKLVGEIRTNTRYLTPNGDGINDALDIFFNILQITEPAPVAFEIYDLAGERVYTAFNNRLGIGPVEFSWDGKDGDGSTLAPGTYIWVLRVESDAFEEVHSGTIAIAY